MLFVHNNKYLPLTDLVTLLQWTMHRPNTACTASVLHPAKYFDTMVWNDLNKQTKQVGLQIGLGSCSMHKWMNGNVWRIKNVKQVSVKPEKNIVKFLKYFRAKNFMKFYITTCGRVTMFMLYRFSRWQTLRSDFTSGFTHWTLTFITHLRLKSRIA